VRFG